MEKASEVKEPRLDAPGAGLPFLQGLLARYYYFPRFARSTSWEGAISLFDRETEKILVEVEPRLSSRDLLMKRCLVAPIRGIEDSSRYWSVAMALEHLAIVGEKIGEVVVRLSRHQRIAEKVDLAAVKPLSDATPEAALDRFRRFAGDFRARSMNEVVDRHSDAKLVHPWFGALDAHGWHCLAAGHQNLHRKQIQAILKGLAGEIAR